MGSMSVFAKKKAACHSAVLKAQGWRRMILEFKGFRVSSALALRAGRSMDLQNRGALNPDQVTNPKPQTPYALNRLPAGSKGNDSCASLPARENTLLSRDGVFKRLKDANVLPYSELGSRIC